jgi:GntR family transcriptional regulator/MocR family aminotransferase
VSRNLVVNAYEQLAAEGYLITEVGRGTRVANVAPAASAVPDDEVRSRVSILVDFEYGIPDVASIPLRDWMWALDAASRSVTVDDLGDTDSGGAGSAHLRRTIAAYQRRVRAVNATAEQVVVVPGFRYGINVALRTLAATGIRTLAIEDPGQLDLAEIAQRSGLDVVPVTVDEHGLDVQVLAGTNARAVVVTPAHQCPTGTLLSPERRHELIRWATTNDAYVIEDDYDAEFRYDRQPVGSVQGLAPDRVINMGSVSKTLSPTLRLAWIIAPAALVPNLIVQKRLTSRGAPGLDQCALAHLIESGRFDRHIRRMRTIYRDRRRALTDHLTRIAPDLAVSGIDAGCHAVIELPQGVDEWDICRRCSERGVRLSGMNRYRTRPRDDSHHLVVGYGNLTPAAIRSGLDVLADLVRDSARRP